MKNATRQNGVFQSRSTKPYSRGIKRYPLKKVSKLKTAKKPAKRTKEKKEKTLGQLMKEADELFSLAVRKRDGKCMHPACKCKGAMLQCSHYIGRAIKSTRWDFDNCITLSWYCHYKNKEIGFEYQKQTVEKHGFDGQYTIFTRNLLGKDRYNALLTRSQQKIRINRQYLNNLILTLKENLNIL